MDYFYKTLLFVTLTVAVRAQTCSTDGSSAKVSTSSITLGKLHGKAVQMVDLQHASSSYNADALLNFLQAHPLLALVFNHLDARRGIGVVRPPLVLHR